VHQWSAVYATPAAVWSPARSETRLAGHRARAHERRRWADGPVHGHVLVGQLLQQPLPQPHHRRHLRQSVPPCSSDRSPCTHPAAEHQHAHGSAVQATSAGQLSRSRAWGSVPSSWGSGWRASRTTWSLRCALCLCACRGRVIGSCGETALSPYTLWAQDFLGWGVLSAGGLAVQAAALDDMFGDRPELSSSISSANASVAGVNPIPAQVTTHTHISHSLPVLARQAPICPARSWYSQGSPAASAL
jgi:hypothetical protein